MLRFARNDDQVAIASSSSIAAPSNLKCISRAGYSSPRAQLRDHVEKARRVMEGLMALFQSRYSLDGARQAVGDWLDAVTRRPAEFEFEI